MYHMNTININTIIILLTINISVHIFSYVITQNTNHIDAFYILLKL